MLVHVREYACAFTAGFEGARCETNADACGSSPCQNSGTCTTTGTLVAANGFDCAFVAGYSGTTCQINVDVCLSMLCNNGTTCTESAADGSVVGADVFGCACAAGYTGSRCGTDLDECASSHRAGTVAPVALSHLLLDRKHKPAKHGENTLTTQSKSNAGYIRLSLVIALRTSNNDSASVLPSMG